tara:strand:- start:273 stop:749 length:477 start_codon:yes stop_codon:yes gene_type:complete
MAIVFSDGTQSFSSKVIQVKRVLRTSQVTTTSSTMADVENLVFTPKSSSSVIHCEFTGVVYVTEEPGGLRGRFYDHSDSNRFGTSLSVDDPLLFRFDLQSLSNGDIYAYCGVTWRVQEASWGTSSKDIRFQISRSGNGTVGFITEFLPATFTITEVIE